MNESGDEMKNYVEVERVEGFYSLLQRTIQMLAVFQYLNYYLVEQRYFKKT